MSLKGHDIAKQLREVDEQERKLQIQKALTLEKAIRSGDVDAIYKAQNYFQLQQKNLQGTRFAPTIDGMKAIVLDPYEISSSMGYYTKNTSISNGILRGMARSPIASAIIRTRKNQVSDFTSPQPDKYSNGFVIKKVGALDESELTDADKRIIEKLTNFMINCGDEDHMHDLDDFNTFARKLVDDALTLDAASIEIIPTRDFEPNRFVAVDGATIRLADTYDNKTNDRGRQKVNGYYPKYVQVVDGLIVAEFFPWEMCYGIRNPSTNIYANGYGRSELEDLVSTVTNLLNADKYNGSIFKSGSSPKGALMVKKGNINKDGIAQIRRDWNAMLSGADQNGKTLILDAESVEWVDMQKSNRDMEYGAFYELLVRTACAVFTISPEEIGFPLQGTKGGGGLGSKEGGKEEKDYSRDKGLKPLLTYIQSWVNKYIIGPKTNFQYEFQFAGLEVESAKEEEERLIKAAAVYLTPDEIRVGKKMKPLPNGMGKLPLSPIIAQMVMGQQQQAQEEEAQQQEKDDAQFANTNPFMDEEADQNDPFKKSFDEYFEKTYVIEN